MRRNHGVRTTDLVLTFDEKEHRYFYGDKEIFGVTTVIKKGGMGGYISRYFTEEARLRGKAVHHAVFLDLHDDLHFDSLNAIIRGYIQGWIRFRKETNYRPYLPLCEKKGMNKRLFYSGTPDCPGFLNGRPIVADIKTGDCNTAKLQLAGYENLDEVQEFLRMNAKPRLEHQANRFDIRLFNNGTYSLRPHNSPNDWLNFVECLRVIRGGDEHAINV